ncbi:hypothetical protein Tco_0020050 [Tanacetum coccineum]
MLNYDEMIVKRIEIDFGCTCKNDKIPSKSSLGQEYQGESNVVMESVEKVVLKSRHWLHDGDLFQEVEKCGGVDSPFEPYLDCVVLLQTCLTKILGFLEKFEGGLEQDI